MKAILAVAVLAMAAFAGVMIVGDDADAASNSITYKVGEESTVRTFGAEAKTFVAPSPSELGFDIDKDFLNWKVEGGSAIYRAGMEYAIPDTAITLVAQFDEKIYVTLVIEDESFKCVVGGDNKIDTTTPEYKAADAALKAIDDSKFRTKGFFVKDADSSTDINGVFTESVVLTQKIVPYFKISFVVEGATISIVDSDEIILNGDTRNVPAAPSKENYAFAGWFDKQGVEVVSFSIDMDKYSYFAGDKFEFTADTTLYAKFVPVNMTVTFQIGEETVTQTVLYGAKAMKPELPAGYVAWMYDGKEFDFNNTPITEEITIVALEAGPVEPTTIYDITFEIADKTPVVQKSDSMVIPDTTLDGYIFQGWVVKNGSQYVDPVEYVKTITNNVTFVAVYKLATESAFTVTFEIEGKSAITQKADSLAIPDTTREGYDFTGWVVKGSSDYVDPMTYLITADITFVAVYKAVEVVEYTVTFINGDEIIDTIKVISGAVVEEIDAPEGMFWLFDFETAIIADTTIEAKPLTVTVQFAVGEKVYNAYTQTIAYGEKIDTAKLADFIFPAGYDSWNYDFNEPVTADMTVYAKAIPEPEKEPKFYETPLGQCAIVIVAFLVGLLGFGLATGRVSVPDLKSSLGKNKGAKKP